jgi:hypothetical protein
LIVVDAEPSGTPAELAFNVAVPCVGVVETPKFNVTPRVAEAWSARSREPGDAPHPVNSGVHTVLSANERVAPVLALLLNTVKRALPVAALAANVFDAFSGVTTTAYAGVVEMDAEFVALAAGELDVAVRATVPVVNVRLTSYLTFTVALPPCPSETFGVV